MSVESQIQTQLEATSALTNLVGTRIYRYQRPRADALPAVTFQRIETEVVNHATGATETHWCRVQVDSWADDMDTARSVADAVATALSGWSNSGGSPSISMSHLQSDIDMTEPPDHGDDVMLYHVSQDYMLSYA